MNYAVVDLGTNSARLMVAHAANGIINSELKALRTIRIGEGMSEGKGITPVFNQDIGKQFVSGDR